MNALVIDKHYFGRFEELLNTSAPEKSSLPAKILGFGEISAVLEFPDEPTLAGWVFKRLPICETEAEAVEYEALCREYTDIINDDIGVKVPECVFFSVPARPGLVVVYAAQKKLNPSLIGNQVLHWAPDEAIFAFFESVLHAMAKICEFNRSNKQGLEVTLDYQLSNWAVDSDEERPVISSGSTPAFIDISTPLFRANGKERLNPDYLLRSCPSFLQRILKAAVVQDVVDRYYDPRSAVVDILANCIKENREDLIPGMLDISNGFFKVSPAGINMKPVLMNEIYKYYRTDAAIWIAYLGAKKIDRFMKKKLGGMPYDFILPRKVARNFPLRNKPK